MIIDLTVNNFTSLKEEQLFSMYAEKDYDLHKNNLFFFKDNFAVLRSSGILGANASGKSNILRAFHAIEFMASSSHRLEEGDPIPCYEPYALCKKCLQKEISFELEFIVNSKRYSYMIKFDQFNIYEESLYYYHSSKPAKMFHRQSATDWRTEEGISLGNYLKGGKRRHGFFSNNSYLSVAGNHPESPEEIREIFQYFKRQWTYLESNSNTRVLKWENNKDVLSAMKSIMRGIDLGISEFEFKDKEIDSEFVEAISKAPDDVREKLLDGFSHEISFGHPNEDGGLTYFDLDRESLGTKRLSDVMPMLIFTLKNGGVLFCDEIEGSFHSHVVDLIIKLFNDPTVNINNAQLIFTTHSIQIMKSKTMRKDQLWLSEKIKGSTILTCLDNFSSNLRDSSPFDKWYAEGRLGGIPSLDYYDIAKGIRRVVRSKDYA
ncbi:AAA family ATPase [Photobacterium phosphoreum]|uniref:AAA family ATPase n=1 Tax=Photobacterium phosphoreum TaxID=659 RepID=UPI0039B09A22